MSLFKVLTLLVLLILVLLGFDHGARASANSLAGSETLPAWSRARPACTHPPVAWGMRSAQPCRRASSLPAEA